MVLLQSLLILLLLCRGSVGQSFISCALKLAVREVDCSDAGVVFTSIPQDAPVYTERIVMTGNNISALSPGMFARYPNLTVLHLDRNQLTTVADGWLDVLPRLRELYLDGNPLVSLDDAVFSNLTSLSKLSLTSTSLATLTQEMFAGLGNLQTLLIENNNQLSRLPANLFALLPGTLQNLSLRSNQLQTIPEGLFDPLNLATTAVSLSGNPWSCDCHLEWFRTYLLSNPTFPSDRAETICQWPVSLAGLAIANHISLMFTCYPPTITTNPEDADILTDRTFSLTCVVDGAPFPNITWLKNGQTVQYSSRVGHSLYNASLQFTPTQLVDAGVYQCLAENENVTAASSNATLKLTESTCFDGAVSSHETDLDCGGNFCSPCNLTQRCRVDSDCVGNLVCLYGHQLPSQLLYISPSHPDAFSCRMANTPPNLLEMKIQAALPTDIFAFNFSVDRNIAEVEEVLRTILGDQLDVPASLISGGSPEGRLITTVERNSPQSEPLVQLWPAFPKTSQGEMARQRILMQLNAGEVKGTVRLFDQKNLYKTRINL